ncbi:hypothetical protein L6452_40552 [Arctium lappa]|uniref:Uncharacterized protein n=1 Tax=Arctium lappa TaxID=4217 RepID=A0ACB8XND5_ARCLA|nr:hypothetical protein L6452_40552 [Arctium lappa]
MECNRDEALRAKRLAEEKMLKNDFEGAQKIALKARQLFPELDNISQVIAVCAVHCSAQRKIYGAEKDLYGILQVENVADEATIRKQYRKLALVLHPDKNKFPGAEAAFKLIGEANMILSDKGKRSVYDFKCREPARASVTKLHNRQGNQSSYARTQFGAQNKVNDVPSSQFNGHGKQSTSHTGVRPSFWTYCPFCNIKYEYYIDFVNRPLRCQHCSKLFIAYDIGAQGAAPGPRFAHAETHSANLGSNRAEPPFFQQKDVGRREKVKVNIQKDGQFPSHFAQHTKTTDTEVGDSSRTRMKHGHIPKETGKEGTAKTNVNVKPTETGTAKDTDRKRGRKMVAESSESSSDVEDAFGGIGVGPVGGGVHRRSSRQRQKVSYREDVADDLSPQKRSRSESPSGDVKEMQKEVSGSEDKSFNTADVSKEVCKQKACAHADADASMANEHKVKEEEAKTVDNHSVSDSSGKSDPELVDCLDPEFSNFDKDKEEHCFAVDQIWACYDSVDGMPRFYAQVRKVYKTEFRLRITWLEATPDEDLEIKWAEEDLPVACGKFVRGETEETKDRLMFSHQIAYKKGGGRFSYVIYPQKGEIWALFKDWDIKWSLDPESHRKYKFDIVEILSVHDKSVSVAFLLKVKGFVSLFQRTIWEGLAEHTIPFTELFRFSHRIPSVKLTGTERAGVPAGSFELDTASLPGDFETYYYSNEVNLEPENVSARATGPCSPSHEEKVKPATGLANTPKKHVKSEATNGLDKEMLKIRRSPRGLKGGDMNHKQVNANDTTPSKGHYSFCKDGDIDTTSKFTKSPGISSPSSACRKLESVIHDFSADKQIWKFQVGQLWAFWERSDGVRQCYAQIKQIESRPPRLHVSLVKLCNIPSNYASRYNACGLFKVSTGKTKILDPDSFSHIVKAEASGNIFNIYPREQQIWALYKRQEGGEFDIVEVLETDVSSIKVLSLSRVPGYKSVFKAPRIQRSTGRILVIPRLELNRFSHQIPAFLFTEEKDGSLRGCWELDHAALTGVGPNQGW